jgi:hypothetical protein
LQQGRTAKGYQGVQQVGSKCQRVLHRHSCTCGLEKRRRGILAIQQASLWQSRRKHVLQYEGFRVVLHVFTSCEVLALTRLTLSLQSVGLVGVLGTKIQAETT